MPQSSQSGPFPKPDSSQPRRLQTPEERFGTPLIHQPEPQGPSAPDPFVALPASSSNPRPRTGGRAKARHERHRFEREARLPPRRSATSRPVPKPASTEPPILAQSQARVQTSDSPALDRIRTNRRRFWKRLSAVALIAILASAGAGALFAPQMNIERVQITGLHATSPVLVKPIAVRLLGHNIFRADRKAIARSVGRLPTIASARVVLHPDTPPRVELQVVERKPIVRVGNGASWWVADKDGLAYRLANAHDAALPALTWSGPVQTMKPLEPKLWADAVRLTEAIEEQQGPSKTGAGLGQIRIIQLDAGGDATMQVAAPDGRGEMTLKLGNDQWREKLARARTAIGYFARTKRKAAELNLVSLDLPRWTPRGVGTQMSPASNTVPST